MASLNKVQLIGRLGQNPKIKLIGEGVTVANFSLATNERYKDKDITEWHNIVCFGKLADVVNDYLASGKLIYLEGRLKTSSWEDKDGGGKKYKTEIVANSIQFLSPRDVDDQASQDAERFFTINRNDNNNRPNDDGDLPF